MRTRSESSVTESKLAMLALTGADRASSDHDPLRYRSYSNLPRQRTESNVYAGYRSEYQLYRRGAVSDNKGQKRSRFDSINEAKEAKTLTQPAPNQFDEEIRKTCGQWCMSKIRGYRHTQIIKEEMVESLRRYNVQSSGDATPFADTCDVTSYINKDRKEIRFSVEKDRKLYRKQEDGDKKLITKLTYTKGNPAKILDQNDDGPDDVPWHVVNKLKELAVLAGVENNLPQDRGEVFRNDGFTSEDISRVFYDYIKPIASENLDIMTNLRLDKTCGLKNVKDFEDTESNEKHLPVLALLCGVQYVEFVDHELGCLSDLCQRHREDSDRSALAEQSHSGRYVCSIAGFAGFKICHRKELLESDILREDSRPIDPANFPEHRSHRCLWGMLGLAWLDSHVDGPHIYFSLRCFGV